MNLFFMAAHRNLSWIIVPEIWTAKFRNSIEISLVTTKAQRHKAWLKSKTWRLRVLVV